ncbi:hypothetical protein [Pedobacter alluvionis]|uniref:Uncharacterized protein n=1 Tax=Pedobacter alluvionis TaxID=475253 RepID=A0A497Y3A0_9SPHI|nr:hypothetical protein [Pedobacter alluvionis]RLJ77373.1 hypothetical protein BCL90_2459 [Pedobacter alluvionis]TFB33407.1 hypothetical protein E3V97_05005 [Pedobacter alluvionis]
MNELYAKPSICLRTKCYSGYLDQHDFIERYLFIKRRISNSLTREELAFLLGRTPYFTNDYEEMSNTTKLDLIDMDLLNLTLKRNFIGGLSFEKNVGRHDISHEKRMVRITRYEYADKLEYVFNHRWVEYGANKPLKLIEPVFQPANDGGEQVRLITNELTKLLAERYFNTKRSPLDIYLMVWTAHKYRSSAWSIMHLKNIIYELIRTEQLRMSNLNGHFVYQARIN